MTFERGIMSQRKKTDKKPGAQKGHEGTTLKQIDSPDHLQEYRPCVCVHCQANLENASITVTSKRQVWEIPLPKIEVTEHQAHTLCCSHCGKETTASFPQGVEQPVQYGPNLLS
jgi:transposase